MRVNLGIRQKISICILSVAAVIFAITIGFFSINSKRVAYKNSVDYSIKCAEHYAALVEGSLSSDMSIARSLASAVHEHLQLPFGQWQELVVPMYKRVAASNPHIDAIWDSWELSYLDPTWKKTHGRWFHIAYRFQGKLLTKVEKRSMDQDPASYADIKNTAGESIMEPYFSALQKGGMMTSLTVPMSNGGNFIGVIGIDLFLGRFQELIRDIRPYEESHAFILSHKGVFVANSDTLYLGKSISDEFPELQIEHSIRERITKGQKFDFVHTNALGERFFYIINPIQIGKTKTPWALGIIVPERVILAQPNRVFNISLIVGLLGLAILALFVYVLASRISRSVKLVAQQLGQLADGKMSKLESDEMLSNDEISNMTHALSRTIDGLIAKTVFAKSIGDGQLDAQLKLVSDDDALGKSLIEMQKSLQAAQKEEVERKRADELQQRINLGLAQFSDVLRENNDNMELLCDNIIKNLVRFLEANVGGVFIKNENENTLDLISSFAYDRKRFIEKSFSMGSGLVGTCAIEGETIHLTEIPQDYMKITSGIGGTNPSALLLVPLKIEGEVLGVIEVASLKPFKSHEIDFSEKLAESISLTLRTVRINENTQNLLQRSQEQAEIMAAQDEEMRQNMEELQATQEESARKASEMEGLINALNASSYVIEYDSRGVITGINDMYLELVGFSREETIGQHHTENLDLTDEQKMGYEQFWANLRKGHQQKQTTRMTAGGKEFIFLETYTPIKDGQGEVSKILKIATDITGAH